MANYLAIDQDLLAQAFEIGKLPTKEATVHEALREFVQRRKQLEAIELFGTIDFDPDYDYRQQRGYERKRISNSQ